MQLVAIRRLLLLFILTLIQGIDAWTIDTTLVPQNQQAVFYVDNAFDGSQYAREFICIPSAQVSYWS
jgi:hypothetical protein